MQLEMDSFCKNHTWNLVDLSSARRPNIARWVNSLSNPSWMERLILAKSKVGSQGV